MKNLKIVLVFVFLSLVVFFFSSNTNEDISNKTSTLLSSNIKTESSKDSPLAMNEEPKKSPVDSVKVRESQGLCEAPISGQENLTKFGSLPVKSGKVSIYFKFPKGEDQYDIFEALADFEREVSKNGGVIISKTPELLYFNVYFCGEWNEARFNFLKELFEKKSYISNVLVEYNIPITTQ